MTELDDLVEWALKTAKAESLKTAHRHYTVFYSNPWLTLKRGPLYVVGTNPAGSYTQTPITLRSTHSPTHHWSAYLDEVWDRSALQTNIQTFFRRTWTLNVLRTTFATNAIFWTGDPGKGAVAHRNFEPFWAVHRRFLDIVRPTTILAFGSGNDRSFGLLRAKLSDVSSEDEISHLYMNWGAKYVEGVLDLPSGPHRTRLLGLPHFSQWHVHHSLEALDEMQRRGWIPVPPNEGDSRRA